MVKDVIFGIIGGLGLFLFGMKYLSDGLQKVAGTKLRRTLRSLTQNRFRGVILGAFVTSIIQSSSVTTVMLVGLINAGIISLMEGASVVIGANIGTTITAQIIAFKIAKYALPALGIGVALMLLARKKKMQFWGQVIFAFGMIFLGLATMSDVMKPLKDVPAVTDFFVQLSTNPILSIMLATLFTVAVQSSSASIGMVIALASVGLIDHCLACGNGRKYLGPADGLFSQSVQCGRSDLFCLFGPLGDIPSSYRYDHSGGGHDRNYCPSYRQCPYIL